MSAKPRCLIWVQTLLGTGHLRRAILLAEALADPGCSVTLANGGRPPPWPRSEGVDLVQLPVITAGPRGFDDLVTDEGRTVDDDVWRARSDTLHRLAVQTDVLVTEMFPFGRSAFRRELLPILDHFGGLVVASVRDILVSKRDPSKMRWMAEVAKKSYHRVLVHGDDELLSFSDSFPFFAEIGERVVHTGFTASRETVDQEAPAAPYDVVVSAGGGAVGEPLLAAAARAWSLNGEAAGRWLLVGGSHLPESDFEQLRASPGVEVVRHRDDLPALMRTARVSVSQAGYNTVVEGLQGGARMVLVPFARDGEDEQTRRAARLAQRGLAVTLAEKDLTPEALLEAIAHASALPRPRYDPTAFEGAARSADIILADHRARHGC
ncbi:MAG: glycosyltransferase [Geminicoccaceae bacterium]